MPLSRVRPSITMVRKKPVTRHPASTARPTPWWRRWPMPGLRRTASATSRPTVRERPSGIPLRSRALTKAFRTFTQRSGYCAIGSVKTNVGHLDAAAAVAGMIKTVLALKHRQLPPSLHFSEANPEIDFPHHPVLREHATAGMDQRRSETSRSDVHRHGRNERACRPRGSARTGCIDSMPVLLTC